MESYKTIAKSGSAELIQKRSRFIGHSFFVKTKGEAQNYINDVKKQHYNARHNVWAYVLKTENNSYAKCSDDGEPHGTGGLQILNMIKGTGLKNVLVVVTRYFGGILLGTGGLSTAYKETAKETLKNSKVNEVSLCINAKFKINYTDFGKIQNLFQKNNVKIIKIDYGETIKIDFNIKNSELQNFKNEIAEIFKGQVNLKIINELYTTL